MRKLDRLILAIAGTLTSLVSFWFGSIVYAPLVDPAPARTVFQLLVSIAAWVFAAVLFVLSARTAWRGK